MRGDLLHKKLQLEKPKEGKDQAAQKYKNSRTPKSIQNQNSKYRNKYRGLFLHVKNHILQYKKREGKEHDKLCMQ